jgi:hypothetical protein
MRSFAAPAYLVLGDRDGAIAELQAADCDRCPWFFAMMADPRLRDLHELEEFRAMQSRLLDIERATAEVPLQEPM